MIDLEIEINQFLQTGFDLRLHLSNYLKLTESELETLLPKGAETLASIHPGSLKAEDAHSFYEDEVGTAHLVELAAWHLNSADYIADTIRLLNQFGSGTVLDFGGGIGTHSIAAALSPDVDHVWFVDINPHNREFVKQRADSLGLSKKISVSRDLSCIGSIVFETIICLDVLEHLPNPSEQLLSFLERMPPNGKALLNWYFFKGFSGEYPFHFDDKALIDDFFMTLQSNFLEVFHPFLITTRVYKPMRK